MPRKTVSKQDLAAAIAALPFAFAPESADEPNLYPNLSPEMQRAVAAQIAKDRAQGLSGADLRTKYSGAGCPTNSGLSGPVRRKVLREHGFSSVVARSYDAYSDGTPRVGSAHARNYGAKAVERQAAALAQVAEEERKAELAAMRKAVRAATGKAAPRSEAKLREAFASIGHDDADEAAVAAAKAVESGKSKAQRVADAS